MLHIKKYSNNQTKKSNVTQIGQAGGIGVTIATTFGKSMFIASKLK